MAVAACAADASSLGDDITIMDSAFYNHDTYYIILGLEQKSLALFCWCSWWKDETFPGFPTCPVVGRVHYNIFGTLIRSNQMDDFFDHDLDPYLMQLYLPFGLARPLTARLRNEIGGDGNLGSRYRRLHAGEKRLYIIRHQASTGSHGWTRRGCSSAVHHECRGAKLPLCYGIPLRHLPARCPPSPELRATFIVLVDSPELLKQRYKTTQVHEAEQQLKAELRHGNVDNIRIRYNIVNQGASTCRN